MSLKSCFAALCFLPLAAFAQTQATCSSSLSVAPANPILGQIVTATYPYQSTLPPSGPEPSYTTTITTNPDSPNQIPSFAALFPTNVPQTLIEGFVPLRTGPITFIVTTQLAPDGSQPLCSNGLPGQTATVNVVPI